MTQQSQPLRAAWIGVPGSARVGLRVTRYQFPGHNVCGARDYDANWLMIAGHVENPPDAWDFEDPCLLTWELRDLIAWLDSILEHSASEISFIEPLLAFAWRSTSADDGELSVRLRGEALSSSRFDRNRVWGEGVVLRWTLPMPAIAAFRRDLALHHAAFPVR